MRFPQKSALVHTPRALPHRHSHNHCRGYSSTARATRPLPGLLNHCHPLQPPPLPPLALLRSTPCTAAVAAAAVAASDRTRRTPRATR
eukprot:41090-Chlamydomonas_euryale.AAC.1